MVALLAFVTGGMGYGLWHHLRTTGQLYMDEPTAPSVENFRSVERNNPALREQFARGASSH